MKMISILCLVSTICVSSAQRLPEPPAFAERTKESQQPGGQNPVLGNAGKSSTTNAPGTIPLQTALQLYAELSERTVLRPSVFPNVKLTINLSTTNRVETLQTIETALKKQGITLVLDGEKFALVAPDHMASKLNPQSSKISTSQTNSHTTQTYPKGTINWTAAPLVPVLKIYAEFLGKKLDQSEQPLRLPNLEIVLKNETALTKEELLYAFETVVGWSGVKLVPADEGLVKAVLISAETSTNPTK